MYLMKPVLSPFGPNISRKTPFAPTSCSDQLNQNTMKNTAHQRGAALVAATLLLATAGCETTGSQPQATRPAGSVPAAASPAAPAASNDLNVTFTDVRGQTRSLNVPRKMPPTTSRGYDADGNFVSLGTLKNYATEAFNSGATSRELETKYKLNRFDGETIEIVVNALLRAGAATVR